MNIKTFKILSIILIALILSMTCLPVFASEVVTQVKDKVTPPDPTATEGLAELAGKVIGLIRAASAIATVILVAVFGFKFIMGSAEEKADYQKSFIPLIVGIVVVFSATFIADLLFKTFG